MCEKNKMLASLLAKTPAIQSSLTATNASPKPTALPQEKLPKDLKVNTHISALIFSVIIVVVVITMIIIIYFSFSYFFIV